MDITYNADGEKLCVRPMSYVLSSELLATPLPHGESAELPQERAGGGGIADPVMPPVLDLSTRYCGNVIFERGNLTRLLTDEGYITFAANGTPTYHYYLRDHLGNVRVVLRQDGTIEQKNDYYPSGTLMATSTNGSVLPYKFGGKELDRTDGIDLYDYGARWMDSKIGARFTTMDPLCEKYYDASQNAVADWGGESAAQFIETAKMIKQDYDGGADVNAILTAHGYHVDRYSGTWSTSAKSLRQYTNYNHLINKGIGMEHGQYRAIISIDNGGVKHFVNLESFSISVRSMPF